MTQDDGRDPWWDDDTTRVVHRPHEPSTPTQVSAGATSDATRSDVDAAPTSRSARPVWLVPVVVVLVTALSFVVVTLLVRHHGSGHATAGVAGSPSASTASSSGVTAAFPADSSTACMENEAEVVNEASDLVRMKQGTQTSCAFLSATRSEVVAHLATASDAQFSVRPYSVSAGGYITLSCRRDGAFTYCEGGRQAKIWVRTP